MWQYDSYLPYNEAYPSLQKVKSIGPKCLDEGGYMHDPINTFACVRVIVKSPEGVRIDHINVENDVELYLREFMVNHSVQDTKIVLSGGSTKWKESVRLVNTLLGFLREKGFYLPEDNVDVFGNLEREVFVFADRVEIYANRNLHKIINFSY